MSAYRVIEAGGYYRLLRDSKLHSTYTSEGAAHAGMETEQRREAAGEAPRVSRSMTEILKTMQANARAAPAYNAADWREFQERFNEVYARAYAARKGE